MKIRRKLISKKPEASAKRSMITAKKKLKKIGIKKTIRKLRR